MEDDLIRLKNVYDDLSKGQDGYGEESYTTIRDDILLFKQEAEKRFVSIIRDHYKTTDVSNFKALEIGTGWGQRFRTFLDMGFKPENLYGIDFLSHLIEKGKHWSSSINFICCDGQQLPFEDESFDIVFQCVAFSSILDRSIIKNSCREMERVLKPDGIIIWIDFGIEGQKKYYNDRQYIQSIPRNEIRKLFSDYMEIRYEQGIYLKPSFWNLCTTKKGYHKTLFHLLNQFEILKSHNVAVIKKIGG